jgi:P pilus assembly chaperone PapD
MPFDVEDPSKKSSTKPVGAVRIASKYIGSLYIAPNGVKPKLVFNGAPSADSKQLILDVENQGTAHQIIQRIKLNLQSSKTGATTEVKEDDLKIFYNQNILASKKRRFTVPWPFGFPIGPMKVSFELFK